jgi:hypothetical protein
MLGTELLYVGLMLVVLALLRFGLPLLVTYLIKLGCCRVLHMRVDRV